ncbi:hypothetical protein K9N08_03575 [Candidatus Gracilibacteria bacterium]|nr:hypothetical protein [Candidatus Gracilibacteria bacterium]MCF7856603.1 hypothetical protein [Candidatus Gracilibacteria bacterium]MCF7896894.1 hypothetical protein [Candidatus Gracilibacteria bacterium]
MQKLLPTLLAILFLAACAPNSVESSEETASEENQTEDNFERNLECQKLRQQVENYFSGAGVETSIEGIFYSPKQKSCLYILVNSSVSNDFFYVSWSLNDVFTNQTIEQYSNHPNASTTIYDIDEFHEKIKEYQN